MYKCISHCYKTHRTTVHCFTTASKNIISGCISTDSSQTLPGPSWLSQLPGGGNLDCSPASDTSLLGWVLRTCSLEKEIQFDWPERGEALMMRGLRVVWWRGQVERSLGITEAQSLLWQFWSPLSTSGCLVSNCQSLPGARTIQRKATDSMWGSHQISQ